MPSEQPSKPEYIEIKVLDAPEKSFYFDLSEKTTLVESPSGLLPGCTIEINSEAYSRLLSGNSTFEQEVEKSNLKIKGDSSLLREFGAFLRQNQTPN